MTVLQTVESYFEILAKDNTLQKHLDSFGESFSLYGVSPFFAAQAEVALGLKTAQSNIDTLNNEFGGNVRKKMA